MRILLIIITIATLVMLYLLSVSMEDNLPSMEFWGYLICSAVCAGLFAMLLTMYARRLRRDDEINFHDEGRDDEN